MPNAVPQIPVVGRFLSLSLALAALPACSADAPAPPLDRAALRTGWDTWTASRDSLFRSDASPLLPVQRPAFDGLPYFPYDTLLAVPAVFVPSLASDTVRFPTTTGEMRPLVASGHLVFEAGGTERRLAAFQPLDPGSEGRLFVPFRDATSGRQTYGGGRYLDLDLAPSGRYVLDLNRAYHPYCVYNPAFSCPLPPAENTLSLPVTAGERLPERTPPAPDESGAGGV